MTNDSASQIINDINAHMRSCGGKASDWYVGIAADPRDTLFNRHGVTEQGGIWIYRQATSDSVARQVEKAYLDSGHDGGPGGGDASTVYVYAYLKSRGTAP